MAKSVGWWINYGRWWMIQWSIDRWFSLGFHVDTKRRWNQTEKIWYGPYIDLHLGCLIVSIGRNPAYSGDLEMLANYGRGGLSGNSR